MNILTSKLLIVGSIVFLIAIGIFIYILIKDSKQIDKEDRDYKDTVWIGIFFAVLIIGFIVSATNWYQCHYKIPEKFSFNFGSKFEIPKFVGIPKLV